MSTSMSNESKIDSPDELSKLIKNKKIENLLLGNGFGLSHPTLSDCFNWDMHSALCQEWDNILHNSLHKDSSNCPETDLNHIRLGILDKILTYYIEKLSKKLSCGNDNQVENLNTLYQCS